MISLTKCWFDSFPFAWSVSSHNNPEILSLKLNRKKWGVCVTDCGHNSDWLSADPRKQSSTTFLKFHCSFNTIGWYWNDQHRFVQCTWEANFKYKRVCWNLRLYVIYACCAWAFFLRLIIEQVLILLHTFCLESSWPREPDRSLTNSKKVWSNLVHRLVKSCRKEKRTKRSSVWPKLQRFLEYWGCSHS